MAPLPAELAERRADLDFQGLTGRFVLRVALHCPYSLSVPGGVQGQVLGLARELGELGHEATVLAPLDAAEDR